MKTKNAFQTRIRISAAAALLLVMLCARAAIAAVPPPALPPEAAAADALTLSYMSDPFPFDATHVQGLFVTREHYFFTGVDKFTSSAYLFKVNRLDGALASKKNIEKLFDFHPGGIDFDGKYIWVPVAVYDEYSHTYMTIVDPETLRHKIVFQADDHIGAVACHGDTIIGANWNARDFYFFSRKGEIIEKRPSPTGVGYQDCKAVSGHLMCTGGGYLDWIDIENWKLAKRFALGQSVEGSSLSREGAAWLDGQVFFLPDDGLKARVYAFSFTTGETDTE